VNRIVRQLEGDIGKYAAGRSITVREMWRESIHGTSYRGLSITTKLYLEELNSVHGV
jgi:hypothetical protein